MLFIGFLGWEGLEWGGSSKQRFKQRKALCRTSTPTPAGICEYSFLLSAIYHNLWFRFLLGSSQNTNQTRPTCVWKGKVFEYLNMHAWLNISRLCRPVHMSLPGSHCKLIWCILHFSTHLEHPPSQKRMWVVVDSRVLHYCLFSRSTVMCVECQIAGNTSLMTHSWCLCRGISTMDGKSWETQA